MTRSGTSPVRYGRKLVNASVTGFRNGHGTALGDQSLSAVAGKAAQGSLGFALLGACFGLLGSCLVGRRKRLSGAIALGTLGSAVGFAAGFGWKTRNLASNVLNSAANEVRRVRDEHWLELNPIDYA